MRSEDVVWEGAPSVMSTGALWAVALAAIAAAEAHVYPHVPHLGAFVPPGHLPDWLVGALHTRAVGAAAACAVPFWRTLDVLTTSYRLTTERIVMATGILTRRYEQVELFRLRDIGVSKPLGMRLFGLGSVDVFSRDITMPECRLHAIRSPVRVADLVRACAERAKDARGVREHEVH